jgi:hypothetical protein
MHLRELHTAIMILLVVEAFGHAAEEHGGGINVRFTIAANELWPNNDSSGQHPLDKASFVVWATSGPCNWKDQANANNTSKRQIVFEPKSETIEVHVFRPPVKLDMVSHYASPFPVACSALKISNKMDVGALLLPPGQPWQIEFREPESVPFRIGMLDSKGNDAGSHYVLLLNHSVASISDETSTANLTLIDSGVWTFAAYDPRLGFMVPLRTSNHAQRKDLIRGREFEVNVNCSRVAIDLIPINSLRESQ